jgi:hypothetical protein
MYGLAYLEHSSAVPGAALAADGQVGPLPAARCRKAMLAAPGSESRHAVARPKLGGADAAGAAAPALHPQLLLQQGAPLPEDSYHGAYNTPILNSTSSPSAALPVRATCRSPQTLPTPHTLIHPTHPHPTTQYPPTPHPSHHTPRTPHNPHTHP